MKEIYSFDVKREVQKEVPHIKKTKDGPVETTKRVKKTIKNRNPILFNNLVSFETRFFGNSESFNLSENIAK